MHVYAIVNRRAGGALDLDAAALERQLQSGFRGAGHSIVAEFVEPAGLAASIEAAVTSNPDVLLMCGGDGAVRSAAQRLVGTPIALGVLPLGTVNRLARDLKIPLEPRAAIAALAAGCFQQIDAAEVNGRIFLCNSLIGLPPAIGLGRQKLRGGSLRVRVAGYFQLLRKIIASRHRIALSVNDATGPKRMRVLSLAVSNNPYGETPSFILTRPRLDSGALGIYIAKHRSGLGLIWVLIRAALGRWKGDPNLFRMTAQRVTIAAKRRSLSLSNDGEVETIETPLNYAIRPKALKMLVPKGLSA